MPNQINEDELQKAIDDITSSAQNGADAGEMPAEASVEGPAPVGAPTPEAAPAPDLGVPPMPPVPPTPGAFDPSTVAPLEGAAAAAPAVPPVPAPEMPPMGEAPAPAPAAPAEEAPMIAPPEGTPEAVAAPMADGAMGEMPAPEVSEMPNPEMPVGMPAPVEGAPAPEMDAGTEQIKAEILRDLSPLMDKVEMEPEKKFHIYKDMMTTNKDKTVIPSAYETAKLIGDEQKRGEALVSLIDAIDS